VCGIFVFCIIFLYVKNIDYLTIKEVSLWVTDCLGKEVTTLNIFYLIQYGHVMATLQKLGHNCSTQTSKSELEKYYLSLNKSKEAAWKEKLG
jgi:hypothetical protein